MKQTTKQWVRRFYTLVALISWCYITGILSAWSQAALLPNAKQTFVDQNGQPLSGGQVYLNVPNTNTPKTTWQDSGETTPNTNPVTLDAAGRAVIYGQGSYSQIVTDSAGNQQWNAPTTAYGSAAPSGSSGTDTAPVGTVLPWAGSNLNIPTNWMLAYGEAISRATYTQLMTAITISTTTASCTASSTTIGGFADTSQIPVGVPIESSCLSPGDTVASIVNDTTVTVAVAATATGTFTATVFPWGDGDGALTFNVPDLRGRTFAGADAMGGTAASRLTSAFYGASASTPGVAGGAQSHTASTTLAQANLPNYTLPNSLGFSGTLQTVNVEANLAGTPVANGLAGASGNLQFPTGGSASSGALFVRFTPSGTINGSVTSGGSGTAATSASFATIQPTLTVNYIIKVAPNTTGAGGVVSLGGMFGDIVCGSGLTCAPIGGVNTIEVAGAGSGTVTSVGLALPNNLFVISGSPVATAGTLSATYVAQAANTFFAGPPSGSASSPIFRTILSGDLPTIPVGGGGTGQTSASAAFNALSPLTTEGDLLYFSSSTNARLAAGAQYNVLVMGTSDPGWGQLNLAQSAAVTGTLGVSNGGTGAATFTADLPLLGNGTGAVAQGTRSGNTTTFATASGTLTNGDCVSINAGNMVDAGGPCTTGGGGGTVSSGTANQLAYYASTGATVTGLSSANNGTLCTNGSGVPSICTTLTSTVQGNITGTGTLTSGSTGSGFTLALGSSTISGTLAPANGGLGANESSATGVVQFASGTSNVSTALANGTTATTQSTGDNSTKLATTAFVSSTFAAPPSLGSAVPAAVSATTLKLTGLSTGTCTNGLSINVSNQVIVGPCPSSGNVSGPSSSTVSNFAVWNNTAGTLLADSGIAITDVGGPPNASVYGTTTIVSGLVPTWPTAAITSCTVISGGTGYTANPTVTPLGGVTNGGTGGGVISVGVSGGAVASCAPSAGGSYSFPPTAYATGGSGNGAQLALTIGSTESFTTSAGTLLVSGTIVNVSSYTHTYSVSSGTTVSYCDFINTSTGNWTTQLSAGGNSNCTVPPSGNILLRIVNVGNGQYECWSCAPPGNGLGFQDGLVAVQYYIPMTAGYNYYDSNTRDWPPVETRVLNGQNAENLAQPNALANSACMQGKWGGRQGNCMLMGNYWVLFSNDQEPIPYGNTLDAGPVLVLGRGQAAGESGNSRDGVTGDLLGYIVNEGANSSGGQTVYSYLLTRVNNASTASGELHLATAGADSQAGASRFVIGGGLYATPSVSGISSGQCGQDTTPSGSPAALTDMGPSTINLCGSATNMAGNKTGYYLDNKYILGLASGHPALLNMETTAAQAYVCYNTSTGEVSEDTTCGSSAKRYKVPLGTISMQSVLRGLTALPEHANVWQFKPGQGDTRVHVGLYANDVEKMDPRCAIYENGQLKNYDDRCVLDYLTVAVKAQQREIARLSHRVRELER